MYLAKIVVGSPCERIQRHQVVEVAHLPVQPLLLHLVLVHQTGGRHRGHLLERRGGRSGHQRARKLIALASILLGVTEVDEEVAVLSFLEENLHRTVAQAEPAHVDSRHG
jgi:hypothetical protein